MAVGIAPTKGSGPGLQDGNWLNGLASGQNLSYQNGITAHSGGTKAAAFQLPAGVALFQIDTVAAGGDSVLLPAAVAGTEINVFNNGANTLDIYGRGTDTINKVATATAYLLDAGTSANFFCAKNGAWGATPVTAVS